MKKSELHELVREVLSENNDKALALALKKEWEKELADDGKLNEALDPVSILGWFLAGNTATNILSKWLSGQLRKFGLNKAAKITDWLEHKTHEIEDSMIQSIKGWLSFIIKDEGKRDDVAKALFAILLGYFIWGEIPKIFTLLGAGLIIVSSAIIFMRESQLKKQVVSPRP